MNNKDIEKQENKRCGGVYVRLYSPDCHNCGSVFAFVFGKLSVFIAIAVAAMLFDAQFIVVQRFDLRADSPKRYFCRKGCF